MVPTGSRELGLAPSGLRNAGAIACPSVNPIGGLAMRLKCVSHPATAQNIQTSGKLLPHLELQVRVSTCAVILLLCLGWSLPAAAGNWTAIPLDTNGIVYGIVNTHLSNHWVVGANGFVARSNMDRTQWTTLDPRTSADLYSISEPRSEERRVGKECRARRRLE